MTITSKVYAADEVWGGRGEVSYTNRINFYLLSEGL